MEKSGDEIGCYRARGMFKEWLKRKYSSDIKRLNRRWKTAFTTFDEPCFYFHEVCVDTERPMAERLLPSSECRMRYADSFEYIGWYAAEVVGTVAGWMRGSGIDIPIAANSWSPLYADFGKFCEVADIAGMDIYPPPHFKKTISITDGRPYPVTDGWLYNVDIVKMTEANVTNGNVWSAEFQSGCYPLSHCGYFAPSHFRFVALALMARGLKAWNWYLLVTQYNWPNSPINEWGWPSEHYAVHKETLALARLVEPWNLTPLNDIGLVVYKPHRVIDPGNFESVFNSLESADISYAYVDLQSSRPIEHSTLVYSGSDWLAAEDLARLEGYVEDGGTLITFSRAPLRDESGKPTRLPLADPEGARPVHLPVNVTYRNGSVQIRNAGHLGCKVNFCYFRKTDGEPMRVSIPGLSHKALELLGIPAVAAAEAAYFTMGYAARFGKGKVIFMGSNPSPHILRLALGEEGNEPYASVDEPLVSTSLFRHRDGHLVLFVVNRNDHRCDVTIRLNAKRLGLTGQLEVTEFSVNPQAAAKLKRRADSEVEMAVNAYDVAVLRIA